MSYGQSHITHSIVTVWLLDKTMSELLYCAGCKCTLELWDEDTEGDEMWIVTEQGEEKTYCESCYASKLQKK
jgi:hypothetical protein